MNAAALLGSLRAAGIGLSREGENLRVRALPGVSIAPFRDRIAAHKPELPAELLKHEIMDALNTDPATFDRPAYERLRDQYEAVQRSLL